jgi:hypothetical protein
MFWSRKFRGYWRFRFESQAGPERGRERRDSFTGPRPEKRARKSRKQKKNMVIKRNSLIRAPNLQASRVPKLSDSRLACSNCTKVNLQMGRGPVKIGFTGPDQALKKIILNVLIFQEYRKI